MKTLFPEPKTAIEARRQANILTRAERLQAEGYRIQQMGNTKLYAIFKPGNDSRRSADRDYLVDMTPGKECCSCKGFGNDQDCKHRISVELRLEEEAALCAQAEEPYWKAKAEDDFRLLLQEGEGGWQFVDAIGRVRIESPSRETLESNEAEIKTALQQSAQMASRCAETGILLRGQVRWNV